MMVSSNDSCLCDAGDDLSITKERIIGQRSWGIYISLKLFLDIGRWFPEKSVKLNSDLFKL